MSAVSFQNLSKTFPDGTRALRGVDLEIAEGEFIALVGPSGCGKTTLLRILAGLDGPSSGTVLIGGTDASGLEPGERDLAMVFQNYALFPHLSVFENLAFGLRARKRPKDEVDQAVRGVADRLGLSGLLKRKPGELSGGQRQRVALGRLLARNPAIHLLDEPLSNLDANLRSSMRDELARLHREHGRTTLYVTHDQVEAMTLGQRICVMNEGEIVQLGTPSEIYGRPATRFVAEFFGSPAINLLAGQVAAEEGKDPRFLLGGQALDLAVKTAPAPGPVLLGLRPESLAAVPSSEPGSTLETTLDRVEDLGDSRLLRLSCESHELVIRTDGEAPATGSTVHLRPDWERAHWFDPSSGARI